MYVYIYINHQVINNFKGVEVVNFRLDLADLVNEKCFSLPKSRFNIKTFVNLYFL